MPLGPFLLFVKYKPESRQHCRDEMVFVTVKEAHFLTKLAALTTLDISKDYRGEFHQYEFAKMELMALLTFDGDVVFSRSVLEEAETNEETQAELQQQQKKNPSESLVDNIFYFDAFNSSQ